MEKILNSIKACAHFPDHDCQSCDYCGDNFLCFNDQLIEDFETLMKEQDTVSGHWLDDTGYWIEGDRYETNPHARTTGEMIDTFRCSWCGFYQYWKTPFCPNCGAKME